MQSTMQQFVNHYVYVLDESGSMKPLQSKLVQFFDSQIQSLKQESVKRNQETRVSVYIFSNQFKCLVFDMDVMRCPSLNGFYNPQGGTALIDATYKSIKDLDLIPQKYGDHAFLTYVLTDGEETGSSFTSKQLMELIASFPENQSIGILVPNQKGLFEAKKLGFPPKNIEIWDTTESGLEDVGAKISAANSNFMAARATGTRSTKNLFELNVASITPSQISRNLQPLDSSEFDLFLVRKESVIKPFAESWTQKPYVAGSCYYQLVKPETIGTTKNICIRDKTNGKVFSGQNARSLLKLPDHEVKVAPSGHPQYEFYVQSTSANRKLPANTNVIHLK